MSDRICENPSCGTSLEGLRADAHYCNAACRREAHRAREAAANGDSDPKYWVRGHWRRKRAKRVQQPA